MEAYVTEEQQLEVIKTWFKKYGNTLLWCITIVLCVIAGIRYWFHHQTVLRDSASEHYIALMSALEQKDEATVNSNADTLLAQFPSSPYSSLAVFTLACEAIQAKDFVKATERLQWVMDHSKQAHFRALARIRLMRLWIDQNQLEKAMALYDEKYADGYLTVMDELKGDILFKQKDLAGAKAAYEKAMQNAPEEGMYGPLLKMKLEDLGGNPELAAIDKEAKK